MRVLLQGLPRDKLLGERLEEEPGVGHHHHHHHHHHHGHHHHEKSLFWAIAINTFLTVVQIVGGVLSGSLSLVADALHNLSDAGALVIAYVAQKVSRRPRDARMTYGYGRAQILGALINSVTLVLVGLYLVWECWARYREPRTIEGGTVMAVAAVALVVDLATAWLTHRGAHENINMRAAFVHNLSDALASVVVLVSGFLAYRWQIYWFDTLATLFISVFVLYHSFDMIRSTVRTLMQGAPEGVDADAIATQLQNVPGVREIHHLHVWAIHEKFRSLEAHVVVDAGASMSQVEEIKKAIKQSLADRFQIRHSTLEFESSQLECHELGECVDGTSLKPKD